MLHSPLIFILYASFFSKLFHLAARQLAANLARLCAREHQSGFRSAASVVNCVAAARYTGNSSLMSRV